MDCKIAKSSLEKRVTQSGKEMHELLDRLKIQQDAKRKAVQELEGQRREHEFIGQQIKEFRALLVELTEMIEDEDEGEEYEDDDN